MKKGILIAIVSFTALLPTYSFAQATLTPDTVVIEKAQVLDIVNSTSTVIAGTDTDSQTQTIHVHIMNGADAGSDATFDNDYVQLHVGDVFYLRHTTNTLDGTDYSIVCRIHTAFPH